MGNGVIMANAYDDCVGGRSQVEGFVFEIKCALVFASTPTRVLHDFIHYYLLQHIYVTMFIMCINIHVYYYRKYAKTKVIAPDSVVSI